MFFITNEQDYHTHPVITTPTHSLIWPSAAAFPSIPIFSPFHSALVLASHLNVYRVNFCLDYGDMWVKDLANIHVRYTISWEAIPDFHKEYISQQESHPNYVASKHHPKGRTLPPINI